MHRGRSLVQQTEVPDHHQCVDSVEMARGEALADLARLLTLTRDNCLPLFEEPVTLWQFQHALTGICSTS